MDSLTIGIDLGDKNHEVCVLDQEGNVVKRFSVGNTKKQLRKAFPKYKDALVAIETGTHSPWISRELEDIGCNVLVGNARKLRMIWSQSHKTDPGDAEMLARIARFDKALLYPIHHRSQQAQIDLEVIKARDLLVSTRTDMVNHVRSIVKSHGERLPKCSSECFHIKAKAAMPEFLNLVMAPLLEHIASLTTLIKDYDQKIEHLAINDYPETKCLVQVKGVGLLTALAFVLIIESADRFQKSRSVGPHIGLVPRKDQSGQIDKHLRITKEGHKYLRRLLVGCSHYILGPFGPDSDLRRFGERKIIPGNPISKRKATVAVARKLSVLLHSLWSTGEVYEPLRNSTKAA